MKRKILCTLILIVTVLIGWTNFRILNDSEIIMNMPFANVEALAGGEWNDWNEWLSQGFTKDEREWKRPCPLEEGNSGYGNIGYGNIGIGGGGSHNQSNPSGREEITCPYGDQNCTEIPCD